MHLFFAGYASAAHPKVLECSAESGHFMAFYMVDGYYDIGLSNGSTYLGGLAVLSVYGYFYVVKSFQAIGNDYLSAYAERGVTVPDSSVLVVYGI